jgi:hypothetical protein
MGVGAAAIGQGGAASASTHDIYAIYWNPAGLAELKKSQVSVAIQPTARYFPIDFVGAAYTGKALDFFGLKSTLAIAWIPRLFATATGAYSESDYQSMFLRFALPGLPGTFNGHIKSKTKDVRVSWAITPRHKPTWSLGLSVARVDCSTFGCGTQASTGQYTITSARATAIAVNVGAKYYVNPDVTVGFMVKDVDTKLHLDLKKTYTATNTSTHTVSTISFPRDMTAGVSWKYNQDLRLSTDFEHLSGNYGSKAVNADILRSGMAYRRTGTHMTYRAGMVIPLVMHAGKLGNLMKKLPFPVLPTLGIGWFDRRYIIDAALYPQAIMSAVRHRPVPAINVTIIRKF